MRRVIIKVIQIVLLAPATLSGPFLLMLIPTAFLDLIDHVTSLIETIFVIVFAVCSFLGLVGRCPIGHRSRQGKEAYEDTSTDGPRRRHCWWLFHSDLDGPLYSARRAPPTRSRDLVLVDIHWFAHRRVDLSISRSNPKGSLREADCHGDGGPGVLTAVNGSTLKAHYLISPTQFRGAGGMLSLMFAPWTLQPPLRQISPETFLL